MKRTFSVLLILCLVLSLLPFGALAADVPAEFEDYIPIRDYFDLYDMQLDLTANYVLVNDIDLTEALAEGGDLYNSVNAWISLGWSNVAADRVPFTGVLDGNGHSIIGFQSWGNSAGLFWQNDGTIRNLTIESGDVHYNSTNTRLGAFCQTNAGLIENCSNYAVANMTSNATGYCGGIAGYNTGVIDHCSNNADVTLLIGNYQGKSSYCGGIAGWNSGTISCCFNGGVISGQNSGEDGISYIGGITGVNSSGIVEKCWNTGSVSGRNTHDHTNSYGTHLYSGGSHVGGVAGRITSSGTVMDVYSTGDVYSYATGSPANAGGIAGSVSGGTLLSAYNRGIASAERKNTTSAAYAGGVIGLAYEPCNTANCFYLSNMNSGVAGINGNYTNNTRSLSDGLMKRQNSFTGFDFDETWIMGTGDYPYPVLQFAAVEPEPCRHEETVLTGAVPATCTEDGYTGDEVCAACGETVSVGSAIPATGHSWGDWVVTTEPTATTEGVETRTCSACDAIETRSIPAQPENCDGGEGCPSKNFTDVDLTAYYHLAMDWAVMNGVTTGVTPTSFRPSVSCTRAQMVTFLWRAAGSPEPTLQESPFEDVGDQYYAKAVLWALENHITTGVDASHFMPNRTVTRAQTVTFLWRMQGEPNPADSTSFPDVPASAYYAKAVAWAAENGVTTGTNGRFNPNNDCTRAQIVTFLYRALEG